MSWGRCGRNVSCRITQFCTVIIVKMPSLNGSNGWTTSIFQILLIAQARSVLREQQLLMCYLVGFFNFVREKATEKTGYKFFDLSVHNFGVRFHVHTSSQGVRNILFYIRGKSVSSTVQLTPPVFSVSSFQGTYSLENKKKWRICHRWTTTGLREWAGGPFMETCILLQIVTTVQSFPSVI